MVSSHIDDLCMCCTNRVCFDQFRFALLDPANVRFQCTYEGPLHHYLGCTIAYSMKSTLEIEYIIKSMEMSRYPRLP